MAEMRDVYHLVKFANSEKYQDDVMEEEFDEVMVRFDLAERFINNKRLLKPPLQKALDTVDLAVELKYLRPIGNNNFGHRLTINHKKAMHLLAKQFGIFRVGLWDESLKFYDTSKTVIVAIIVAVIGSSGLTLLITSIIE